MSKWGRAIPMTEEVLEHFDSEAEYQRNDLVGLEAFFEEGDSSERNSATRAD